MTWECAGHLRSLVTSLNAHLSGDQELVVVDNASTDSPADAAAHWKGRHRFVTLDRNAGFGAASNRGATEASEDLAVLLNPDTELLDDGLDRLAATAGSLDALVGPRLLNPDLTVQPSASGPEVGGWPWVRALAPAAIQPEWIRARTEPYRLERRVRVSWLNGACIAGPIAILRRLGPFDPALHMYGEDVDLGLRAGAAGIRSWFDPAACRLVHHGQGSSALLYGSAEGWRPTGTLNWRAAVRRAQGARREALGWRALRLNLGLRLIGKTLIGRATDRDRAALAGANAADPAPILPPAPSPGRAGDVSSR